jgi:glycosyltransferase involved in cell wall biosynthesis
MLEKLLIITNMGPKASAPFQGQFVTNQVNALAALHPAYFFMTWHNDSKLNRLLKYPVLWLQFIWRFVLSRQSYDIVHVHYYYPTIWLAWTYKLLRNRQVKIVVTCHGSDIYLYKPESTLYKFAASAVNFFIFTSESLRQKFYDQSVQSLILPAGIHPTFADSQQFSLAEKPIDVLFVGTLDHNKGVDRLLKLVAAMPDVKFAVVGHGPLQHDVMTAAARVTNLQLLSSQSPIGLKAYFEQSKCLMSLSRNESFGLVMTEAMACYTPVLATVTDGSKAQIVQGQNGFCFAQNDEAALLADLMKTVQQLLRMSTAEYQHIQQACRTSASPYFVEKIAAQLTELYQQLARMPENPIK